MPDKIKNSPSSSIYSQMVVPSLDGTTLERKTFDTSGSPTNQSNIGVSIADTSDGDILINLVKELIPISRVSPSVQVDGSIIINNAGSVMTVVEPPVSSDKTQSNKVTVNQDKDGMVFLFDHTAGNKRIFLRHPTGSYFTYHPDGSLVTKTTNDKKDFVIGNNYSITSKNYGVISKGDMAFNAQKDYSLTVNRHFSTDIGGTYGLSVIGNAVQSYGANRYTEISGYDIEAVEGAKVIEGKRLLVLSSNNEIIVRAPTLTYEVGKFNMVTRSSFGEKVSGVRRIVADSIVLSSTDNFNMFSAGPSKFTTTGSSVEVIMNSGFSASTNAKELTISLGNYMSTTLDGSQYLQAGPAGIAGSLAIEISGVTTIKSLLQTVLESKFIMLGSSSASEPFVKGLSFMSLFNSHVHPAPGGTTAPPSVPMTPSELSSKIFGE